MKKILSILFSLLFSLSSFAADFPLRGHVRSVVILVSYKDVAFTVPNARQAFYRMLNEEGYSENDGTGSAADYFKACSMGVFQPTFDVYGPYTLSQKRAYYGGNDAQGNDKNARQMIIEACQLAAEDGVDFSVYDTDNDGYIDNVFVYYAGTNPAEGGPADAVWPHRSIVYPATNIGSKKLYDYACTSELSLSTTQQGSMCGIGTFCHEFSHVLGLPDMYNTASSNTYTVGTWDIMCSGNYNRNGHTPPTYSAFERFMLGWLTPTQLENTSNYTISPMENSNEAFLIATAPHNLSPYSPSPAEYWMIENRQQVGWDKPDGTLPGTGLIISHITFNRGAWSNNTFNNSTPLGYDICEAYNRNPRSSSPSDPYPGTGGITYFVPTQNNGVVLQEQQITGIRYLDEEQILFRYGKSGGAGFYFEPDVLPTLKNHVLNGKSTPQPQVLHVYGSKLEDSAAYALVSDKRNFSLSLDSVNWTGDTLWLPLEEDSLNVQLYVRYQGAVTCQEKKANLTVSTRGMSYINQTPLSGYAERPMLIDSIRLSDSQQTTPYAYLARWEEQSDAEIYYLTLCEWKDEPQQILQSFENFTTIENIEKEGWWANFVRRTSTCSDGKNALHMITTGDCVRSEHYLSPVEKMSFWLSQNYRASEEDSHGICLVEASADGERWEKVDQIRVTSLTRSEVHEYTFSTEKGYICFRITNIENEGSGGLIVDAFRVTMPRTAHYIYRNQDYPIYAPADSVLITGLTPATTYSYQLLCTEDKGCTPHWSPMTAPKFFTTMPGGDDSSLSITYDHGTHTVYLSDARGDKTLYVYDLYGHLVWQKDIAQAEYIVTLPSELFLLGQPYVLKYSVTDKLKRKDRHGKIIF